MLVPIWMLIKEQLTGYAQGSILFLDICSKGEKEIHGNWRVSSLHSCFHRQLPGDARKILQQSLTSNRENDIDEEVTGLSKGRGSYLVRYSFFIHFERVF